MGKIKIRKEGVEFSSQNKNSAETVCFKFIHKEGDKKV